MKSISLQDQLLNAGLTTKSKANKVKIVKRKKTQQKQKNKIEPQNQAGFWAQKARAEQLEKDRLLNEKRQRKIERRETYAQIAQLVNANKLAKDDEGNAFNFSDKNKIKTIYIADDLRQKIVSGQAVVINLGKSYEVVLRDVADKVAERDPQRVIDLSEKKSAAVDDEYADFAVPDDLVW